jgi:hypothetical protein
VYRLVPFTAPVNAGGDAIVEVSHSLSGIQWKVYQVGLALGQPVSGIAQVAAHLNGAPLAASVNMQPSAFASMTNQGHPPYAMESFIVGPPYLYLMAGDQFHIGVVGAVPGDTFTAGVYLDEQDALEPQNMGS